MGRPDSFSSRGTPRIPSTINPLPEDREGVPVTFSGLELFSLVSYMDPPEGEPLAERSPSGILFDVSP